MPELERTKSGGLGFIVSHISKSRCGPPAHIQLVECIFRARRLTAVTIENTQKGRIVSSLATLGKVVLGLHGSDLLGRGDDQKLVHAGPVALADLLHLSL